MRAKVAGYLRRTAQRLSPVRLEGTWTGARFEPGTWQRGEGLLTIHSDGTGYGTTVSVNGASVDCVTRIEYSIDTSTMLGRAVLYCDVVPVKVDGAVDIEVRA